jgi:hypothetical protein
MLTVQSGPLQPAVLIASFAPSRLRSSEWILLIKISDSQWELKPFTPDY